MGEIFVGTSGFSFDDWVGEVYPSGIKKHEMLQYYERTLGFRTLEVNYTYYAMPSIKTMESFSKRTSKDFSFVVKAFKGMTHEKREDLKTQCRLFQQGIAPLGENLKAVLFQFPYSFVPSDGNIDYLKSVREEFHGFDSVIEFRNARWSHEQYTDVLRGLSLGYCVVDEPKLKGLLPFTPLVTSDTGYFRFHGRNRAWFREPVNVRYDYLYTEKELEEFVDPIVDVAQKSTKTFVFFNNCHAGKAVKNAMMMIEMLKSSR
ncbi:MAG: hypothetical protein A4E64_01351 [Syntrophorhabdus sp. PtaU1.Bin058]|nr:MAG: hypothetical protein A4E64_01351 [Syntrophorhabdus sp. PtaU1.Bin058]